MHLVVREGFWSFLYLGPWLHISFQQPLQLRKSSQLQIMKNKPIEATLVISWMRKQIDWFEFTKVSLQVLELEPVQDYVVRDGGNITYESFLVRYRLRIRLDYKVMCTQQKEKHSNKCARREQKLGNEQITHPTTWYLLPRTYLTHGTAPTGAKIRIVHRLKHSIVSDTILCSDGIRLLYWCDRIILFSIWCLGEI